jgi:hypothetical protein
MIRRIWTTAGFSSATLEEGISDDDLQLLRYMAAVLPAGFPLVAFLQLVRVYGLALAQIADAEVKLFHLFVHEPLIRDGVDGLEIAEEMEGSRPGCRRSPRPSWSTCISAGSSTSSSRTSWGTWSWRSTATATWGGCASASPSRTWPATPG